jgi:hypothetical protein
VAVQRHRLDAQRGAELAHAERIEPVAVDEVDRRPDDAVPAERLAGHVLRPEFTA